MFYENKMHSKLHIISITSFTFFFNQKSFAVFRDNTYPSTMQAIIICDMRADITHHRRQQHQHTQQWTPICLSASWRAPGNLCHFFIHFREPLKFLCAPSTTMSFCPSTTTTTATLSSKNCKRRSL